MARDLGSRGSENKDADQLYGYCTAELCLFFTYAKSRFSHDAAHIMIDQLRDVQRLTRIARKQKSFLEKAKITTSHSKLDHVIQFKSIFLYSYAL